MPAMDRVTFPPRWASENKGTGERDRNGNGKGKVNEYGKNVGCSVGIGGECGHVETNWFHGVPRPLSTSPVPKIRKIPSVLLSPRSLSPSPPPQEPNPPNLFRRLVLALSSLLWKKLLIVPTLWLSGWFWLFWKCTSFPLAASKRCLDRMQGWPAKGLRKRSVLISGGSTVQALHLARNFYSAGARVIVCEVEGHFTLARFSTAVTKFYTVPKPNGSTAVDYVNALCTIVEKENVSYYIPASATCEAFYDALAKPQLELLGCVVFCPVMKEVLFLDDLFEVLNKCRVLGLPTPPYHLVTSREDVLRLYETGLLRTAKHYMTNVGPFGISERIRVHVPPLSQDFRTRHEISSQRPWVLVQNVSGDHYVTCTTVKEAQVVGNVTCRVESDSGGLVPVDNEEITRWIQNFFTKLILHGVSGHFSFRFAVPHSGSSVIFLGCRVGVSLPYICFTGVHPRIVWKPCKHFSRQSSGPLVANRPRYWMHDAVLSALRHPSVGALAKLVVTVLDKREALFSYWDPLPYCAYYHIQLPLVNLANLIRRVDARRRRISTASTPWSSSP